VTCPIAWISFGLDICGYGWCARRQRVDLLFGRRYLPIEKPVFSLLPGIRGLDEVGCIKVMRMPTNGSGTLSCGNLFDRILGVAISLLDISWMHRLSWDKLLRGGFPGA